MADVEGQFWYDLSTGQVDEGGKKGAAQRLGPYATRAEAQAALDLARRRTEAWDAQDADD